MDAAVQTGGTATMVGLVVTEMFVVLVGDCSRWLSTWANPISSSAHHLEMMRKRMMAIDNKPQTS